MTPPATLTACRWARVPRPWGGGAPRDDHSCSPVRMGWGVTIGSCRVSGGSPAPGDPGFDPPYGWCEGSPHEDAGGGGWTKVPSSVGGAGGYQWLSPRSAAPHLLQNTSPASGVAPHAPQLVTRVPSSRRAEGSSGPGWCTGSRQFHSRHSTFVHLSSCRLRCRPTADRSERLGSVPDY